MAIKAFVGGNLDARCAAVFSGCAWLTPTQSAVFNYTQSNMSDVHPMARWRATNRMDIFTRDGAGPDDQRIPMPVKERKKSWAAQKIRSASIIRTHNL